MSFRLIEPHTIADANFVDSSVLENDYPAWDVGTTYADKAFVIVVTGGEHTIYRSLQDGNVGKIPGVADSALWWQNIGSTNRWKAFDRYIGDPTIQADGAAWELTFPDVTNSVALFGLFAATVQIEMRSSDDELIFDETYNLQDESGVVDAVSYISSPVIRAGHLVVSSLPPFSDCKLKITASNPGLDVQVGQIVVGRSEELGFTVENVPLSGEDFSLKNRDEFGRYSFRERDFANEMSVSFAYRTERANYIRSRLASRRAKPTVYSSDSRFGDNEYVVYGIYLSFELNAGVAVESEATIELESLT